MDAVTEKTLSRLRVRLFTRWSLGIALSITGIAIAYALALRVILHSVRDFHQAETWRQPLLNQRVIGYRGFLFALAAATWVFSLILKHSEILNRSIRPHLWSQRSKNLSAVIVVGVGISIDIWLSYRLWLDYGKTCWDGYCSYASLIRGWLIGPLAGSKSNLTTFMHQDFHSNSPVGPALIAILSILTGLGIEASYALMSGLATLGILALSWSWLGDEHNRPRWSRLAAFLLLLTHPSLVRSFVFLQTDALLSLWIMTVISLGLRRFRNPQLSQLPVATLLASTGLLVKLSFLPALVFVPAMEVVRYFRNGADFLRTVLIGGVAFSIVPLISFWLFQHVIGTEAMFAEELRMKGYGDRRDIVFIVDVTVRSLLFFAPLILLGWKRFRTTDCLLAMCVMIYLLSLWAGSAPGWDRHYLAVIPPITILAAKGLDGLADRFGLTPAYAYVLLASVLRYSSFAFEMVH